MSVQCTAIGSLRHSLETVSSISLTWSLLFNSKHPGLWCDAFSALEAPHNVHDEGVQVLPPIRRLTEESENPAIHDSQESDSPQSKVIMTLRLYHKTEGRQRRGRPRNFLPPAPNEGACVA
jgi:hypothetical protein